MAAGQTFCVAVVGSVMLLAGVSLLFFAGILASWESENLSFFYGSRFFEPIGVLTYGFDFFAEVDPDADGSVVVGTCDDYSPVETRRGLAQFVCNDIEFELGDDTFTTPVQLSTNMERQGIGDSPIQNPTFGGMRFTATDCDVPPAPIEGWDDVLCGTCLPVPTAGYSFAGYRIRCGGLQSNLNRFLLAIIIGSSLTALGIMTICCACSCKCCGICGKSKLATTREPLLRERRGSINIDAASTVHSSTSDRLKESEASKVDEAAAAAAARQGSGADAGSRV